MEWDNKHTKNHLVIFSYKDIICALPGIYRQLSKQFVIAIHATLQYMRVWTSRHNVCEEWWTLFPTGLKIPSGVWKTTGKLSSQSPRVLTIHLEEGYCKWINVHATVLLLFSESVFVIILQFPD
jgi:hypothetical protein